MTLNVGPVSRTRHDTVPSREQCVTVYARLLPLHCFSLQLYIPVPRITTKQRDTHPFNSIRTSSTPPLPSILGSAEVRVELQQCPLIHIHSCRYTDIYASSSRVHTNDSHHAGRRAAQRPSTQRLPFHSEAVFLLKLRHRRSLKSVHRRHGASLYGLSSLSSLHPTPAGTQPRLHTAKTPQEIVLIYSCPSS